MNDAQILQTIRAEIARSNQTQRYNLNTIPQHAHTGKGGDAQNINQNDITPKIRSGGRITMAHVGTYNLGITFNPTQVLFYGAVTDASLFTFTVTTANATIGAVYSNNGAFFTVQQTIVEGTTLNAVLNTTDGSPSGSGTLTLVSGAGDATIAFSMVTAPSTGTRALCIGNAQLGPSFYFQPQTVSSVTNGKIGNIYQSSTSLLTVGAFVNSINVDEGHLIDVESSGLKARATVTDFSSTFVKITVSTLASGWVIVGNFVVT